MSGRQTKQLTGDCRRLELYVQASLWTDITGVFVAVAMLVTLAVKRACPCILFYAPFPMLLLYACVLCSMVRPLLASVAPVPTPGLILSPNWPAPGLRVDLSE